MSYQTRDEEQVEEILISCPNCRKQLVLLVVNYNKPAEKWSLYADCGWCRQRSFKVELTHKPYFSATKDCRIVDVENLDANTMVFKTVKGNNSYGEF